MSFLFWGLFIINSLFLISVNPLTAGALMLLQTFALSILSGIMLPSFWFSYILILVYLGGLLILFIYVATLAANEQINPSSTKMSLMFMIAGSMLTVYFFNSLEPTFMISSDNYISNLMYYWMFTPSLLILAALLMIYLFIALVAVVKITKWWGGSLRPL